MSRSFLDKEETEAAAFQERVEARRQGKHRPKSLPRTKGRAPKVTRFLVIGDSHAHPEVTNERFEWLGRMINALGPDVVVDIGDSADLPSLREFDKARPSAIFEGYSALWRDVDAYLDSQDRLMGLLARAKHQPALFKCTGNHEYRLSKVLKHEPRLRGIVGPHLLREADYGWTVQAFEKMLSVKRANFCHSFPGGSSKTGPRGVVTAKPGTSGLYLYGHTHRRGVYYYNGLKPCHGTILNVGCYFNVHSPSHQWAGDDVLGWHAGIQLVAVDGHGRLRSEMWYDYDEVQQLWG